LSAAAVDDLPPLAAELRTDLSAREAAAPASAEPRPLAPDTGLAGDPDPGVLFRSPGDSAESWAPTRSG
jgi:hypothetical protein